MTVETLWAAAEQPDGAWEVVDNTTSTAYVVDGRIGTRLWQRDDLWPLPLREALDTAGSNLPPDLPESTSAFLDLELAGVMVRYQASAPAALHELRTGLTVARPQRRRTADILIRLDQEARTDLLHRSVAGDRAGVSFRRPDGARWRPLQGTLPALPPLAVPPYRGRFIALHAALLVLPSGCALIVCGNQKAGKTTAALWARDAGLAAVASDEVVLLDRLTGVAFGVPLATAVRSRDDRTAIPLPPGPATHLGAALPAGVVVLVPAPEMRGGAMEVAGTEAEALSWIAEHLRDAGASPADLRLSVRALVSGVPVYRLGVSPWPGLLADLETALAPLLKTLERH